MALAIHPTALAGLALSAAGAVFVWVTQQGTPGAAGLGFVVAAVATAAFGAGAFLPLAVFVLGSGALTRTGRTVKQRMRTAEANEGRRGAANVGAKLVFPALVAGLAILTSTSTSALALAYTASLAGAFADTTATETGPLVGSPAFVVRGLRLARVAHGTPGATSVGGFLAAAAASILLAGCAYGVALVPEPGALAAATAGLFASTLESVLGQTALGAAVGHHGRNLFVSIASAGAALSARAAGWVS